MMSLWKKKNKIGDVSMNKIILLMLFPAVVNAFQTDIQGAYNSSDLDSNSSVTTYLVGTRYYFNNVSHTNKLFNEVGFLDRVSSLDVTFGKSDFDLSVPSFGKTTFDGTAYGLGLSYYQGDLYLSGNYFSLETSSENFDGSSTKSYSISPGYFVNGTSLVFLKYGRSNTSISTEEGKSDEYGIGYKTVFNNINVEATLTQFTVDGGISTTDRSVVEFVLDYYIRNSLYLGGGYVFYNADGADNGGSEITLHAGGLIDKAYSYFLEYSEDIPDVGETATSISVGAGVYF